MAQTEGEGSVVEALIDMVKERELIWSLGHPDHKDAAKVKNSWEDIFKCLIEQFGRETLKVLPITSPKDTKMKFRNLKVYYGRQKRKTIGKSGDGLGNVSSSRWTWYRQLGFLDGANSTAGLEDSSLFSPDLFGSQDLPDIFVGDFVSESSTTITVQDDVAGTSQQSAANLGAGTSQQSSIRQPWSVGKAKKKRLTVEKNDSRMEEAFLQACGSVSKDDADSSFGKFVGHRLSEMSPAQKSRAQIKIMQILTEPDDY